MTTETTPVVHSDPDILGGTPVFVGTRVPARTLLEYLEAGDSLDEFLQDFPSVTREQAVAMLGLAKPMLVAHANLTRTHIGSRADRVLLIRCYKAGTLHNQELGG